MGIVFFLFGEKVIFKGWNTGVFGNYYHDLWAVFEKRVCFADLLSEVLKKHIE